LYYYDVNKSDWLVSILGNTTSISSSKSDESLYSPSCSPWILDDPISIGIISDSEDGMIQWFGTIAVCSWFIWTPIGCINSDWNWINLDGSLQWSSWDCWNTCRIFSSTCCCTFSILSSVWISSFSLETMRSSPLECSVRITSIASLTSTSMITIN